ncbi:alpha/beta fold hydrolase [Marinobacter sp.]|uniref:alpha/beta fold hydrolase n=1 Tax=Marinobacter sp. TaxID=50741 RepID=UPI002638774F|nr:alpha/beta fold hydrolase [Marinobacter sp.]
MNAVESRIPLVVVGGWGVDAAMLLPLFDRWPGEIHLISLNDALMSRCDSVTEVADYLLERYPCPSVWAGWSQGAQVVMAAASRGFAQVSKAITLAGFPRFVAGPQWPAGMTADTFEAFREQVSQNAGFAWRRFQQLLIHGCPDGSQARQELRPWLARGPLVSDLNLALGLDWLGSEDQRSLWSALPVPTLHLQASEDVVVQCWEHTFHPSQIAKVVSVPGMTHWPRGQALSRCHDEILRFVFGKEVQWTL